MAVSGVFLSVSSRSVPHRGPPFPIMLFVSNNMVWFGSVLLLHLRGITTFFSSLRFRVIGHSGMRMTSQAWVIRAVAVVIIKVFP